MLFSSCLPKDEEQFKAGKQKSTASFLGCVILLWGNIIYYVLYDTTLLKEPTLGIMISQFLNILA